MQLTSNYNITQLFVSRDITIMIDNQTLIIHLPSVREIYRDKHWGLSYNLWTRGTDFFPFLQDMHFETDTYSTSYKVMQLLCFSLGAYQQFRTIYDYLLESLNYIFGQITLDTNRQTFIAQEINITEEIWEYVLSIIKLSYGEKVTLPPTFTSEEAKRFYLAQKNNEEKIRRLKSQRDGDNEGLMKMFLVIIYAFPSISIDWLWDQTLAQIQWLQKYAAGAMSYEVNAQAYAAGNVKKGKKLDFFIK